MATYEGSLDAPKRHPIDWKNPDFYKEAELFSEMDRVFDICHGFGLAHKARSFCMLRFCTNSSLKYAILIELYSINLKSTQ